MYTYGYILYSMDSMHSEHFSTFRASDQLPTRTPRPQRRGGHETREERLEIARTVGLHSRDRGRSRVRFLAGWDPGEARAKPWIFSRMVVKHIKHHQQSCPTLQ